MYVNLSKYLAPPRHFKYDLNDHLIYIIIRKTENSLLGIL